MNTIAPSDHFPIQTSGADHGLSPEAEKIRSALAELTRESAAGTVTSRRAQALARLEDAFEEGELPDWDGEGAAPVALSTYEFAAQLIDLLPAGLPVPEIYPEPDGDLALEWDLERRKLLSISVGPDGRLNFAGLFGNSTPHGMEFLGDRIPDVIWDALGRLAE